MTRSALLLGLLLLPALAGGCGGYYILSVPDQLGSTEGQIVPVCRLQRQEVFLYYRPQPGAGMRFRVFTNSAAALDIAGDRHVDPKLKGLERACATDELGYAAVTIPLAEKPVEDIPGVYALKVSLQDPLGDEIRVVAPTYVWDKHRPVVAVEFDALPQVWDSAGPAAAKALQVVAKKANILYLTRTDSPTQETQHIQLRERGFPDGPVLLWQRERWHIVRSGKFKMPRVVIETRLVSQLPGLRETFPNFTHGIAATELAAKAFENAGLTVRRIGLAGLFRRTEDVSSWDAIAAEWQ